MNRFGQQQRYDGGSTERGDDPNRQEHGARHETGESAIDGFDIPFPPFLPNREKTLSVRKHPILRLTTSSLSSLMTQHGYRIITHMYSTLFAEHPEIASMFRKEDHTVQPGESYERQPLLVAQAVRPSPRFLFLAPDSLLILLILLIPGARVRLPHR